MATLLKPANRPTLFLATAGIAALLLGVALLATDSSVSGVGFAVLGIFLWSIAGFGDRIRKLALNVLGARLEAELADREHGDDFAEAALGAPDSVLEAVIPLLRGDAASAVIEVGPTYDGRRLVDPELSWLRQELNVTVFAVWRPGDGEKWTGGGRISELPLPTGSRLAVLGEKPDVVAAVPRLAG